MARYKRKKKEKKSNFTYTENEEFKVYRNGAIAGGLFGAIGMLILKKNPLWGVLIGSIGGGYIAFTIYKDDSNIMNLDKFKRQ